MIKSAQQTNIRRYLHDKIIRNVRIVDVNMK